MATAVANYDDVSDYEGAGRMVAQAVDTYGRLDMLVNNAGIVRDGAIWNMSEADFDSVIKVHLKGTWAPAHHAARHWRERAKAGEVFTGRVINTTSGAGLVGNFGQTNYATAKAGIAGFTQTLSLELYKLGVTVNAVGPAAATRITGTMPGAPAVIEADDVPDDEWNRMDPAVSSPLVAWLASDESQHVTGQVIRAVAEDIVWMKGWTEGATISNGGKRWDADQARPAARHRRLQDPRPRPALLTPTASVRTHPRQAEVGAHRTSDVRHLGMLVGPGVVRDGCVAGLQAFARRVGCGVVNTWGAKGVFRWDDPLHFGTAGLQARDFELAGLGEVDVLVTSGLDPAEVTSRPWEGKAEVIDVAPSDLATIALDLPPGSLERPALYTALAAVVGPMYEQPGSPPARAAALAAALPSDGLVVAEPGLVGFWVARTFPTSQPGSVLVGDAAAATAAAAKRPVTFVTATPVDVPGAGVDVWDDVDLDPSALIEVAGEIVAWPT